jgi:hypothetical protein
MDNFDAARLIQTNPRSACECHAAFGAAVGEAADVVAALGAEAEAQAFLAEALALTLEGVGDWPGEHYQYEQEMGEGYGFEMAIEVRIGGVEAPEFEAEEGVRFSFGEFVVWICGAGIGAVLPARIPGEQISGWSEFNSVHQADAPAAGPELDELEAGGFPRPEVNEGVAGGAAADPKGEVGEAEY